MIRLGNLPLNDWEVAYEIIRDSQIEFMTKQVPFYIQVQIYWHTVANLAFKTFACLEIFVGP